MSQKSLPLDQFLKELYRMVKPAGFGSINMYRVGKSLGLDDSITRVVAVELKKRGLVHLGLGGTIGISDSGKARATGYTLIPPAEPSGPENVKEMNGIGLNITTYESGDSWKLFHPRIVDVAKRRFEAKQYADSVEASMKAVNARVKKIYKQRKNKELDGRDLMFHAFSVEVPVIYLGDMSTITGKDMQEGYMYLFGGSMQAIRNPKAHENMEIDAKQATHMLFLASLLMYKLDDAKCD